MGRMFLLIPVAATIIGLVVYLISANPKAAELGRLAFAVGMLVSLWVFNSSGLHLGK